MKISILPLAALFLAPSAFASLHQCELNDVIKIAEKGLDVKVSVQTAWLGSYYIKSGNFSYTLDKGQTVSGTLNCNEYDANGYQYCSPDIADPVIEKIMDTNTFGLFVKVRDQNAIGPMQCKKSK